MESNLKPNEVKQPRSFLAGILFGCLATGILGLCVAASLIAFIARASNIRADNRVEQQTNNPVESGQNVFQSRCSSCHSTGTEQVVGPGLAGLFSPGGPQLPGGVDYDGKLSNGAEINEANVADWIRHGGRGHIGFMPSMPLNDRQMSDLLEFLKTLEK